MGSGHCGDKFVVDAEVSGEYTEKGMARGTHVAEVPFADGPYGRAIRRHDGAGLQSTGLGLGIASVVCGTLLMVYFSLPLGIAGIACSVAGKSRAREVGAPCGKGNAGLAFSIAGVALSVAVLAGVLWVFVAIFGTGRR